MINRCSQNWSPEVADHHEKLHQLFDWQHEPSLALHIIHHHHLPSSPACLVLLLTKPALHFRYLLKASTQHLFCTLCKSNLTWSSLILKALPPGSFSVIVTVTSCGLPLMGLSHTFPQGDACAAGNDLSVVTTSVWSSQWNGFQPNSWVSLIIMLTAYHSAGNTEGTLWALLITTCSNWKSDPCLTCRNELKLKEECFI